MTCRVFIGGLGSYFVGELPSEARARLEDHARCCTSCRDYLETYRETVRLVRRAYGGSLDPGLAAGVS